MGKRYSKKNSALFNAGQHQTIDLIAALSKEHHSIKPLCKLFEIPRNSYHYRLKCRGIVTPEKALLRQKVVDIHSRGYAGQGQSLFSLPKRAIMLVVIKQLA